MNPLVVLGIDPGSRRTGFGLIRVTGRTVEPIAYGAWSAGDGGLASRLVVLGRALEDLLQKHEPDHVSVEQAFHARNARSTLVLGHARGVLMWIAAVRGVPVHEFAPRAVKLSVTGRGAASKPQVAGMVQRILGLTRRPVADAADALAIALCCARRLGLDHAGATRVAPEAQGAGTDHTARTARTARTQTGEVIDLARAFGRVRKADEARALESLVRTRGPARRGAR
ncbi:MAG: crossover junction endodeoxyribonuclease RuvC [Candidatus Eiseniibacteriota bacterium]